MRKKSLDVHQPLFSQPLEKFHHRKIELSLIITFVKTIITIIIIDIMFAKIIITGLGFPSRPANRPPGCQTIQHPFLQQGDLFFNNAHGDQSKNYDVIIM